MTAPNLTFAEAVGLRIASADQQYLMRHIAIQWSGRPVASHTWYRTLAEDVVQRLIAFKDIRICPHLGPGRGFGPMYCTYTKTPMKLQCRICVSTNPPKLGPVDENTCDRCDVYSRNGLLVGMYPLGPMLIGFGLCDACTVEVGAARAVD
jgi:hypothetical protein